MSSQNDQLLKLQAIATAREFLNSRYKQCCAEEYAKWTSNNANAWRGNNMPLPFPPFVSNAAFAPFQTSIAAPTEEDVIDRALILYMQSITTTDLEKTASAPQSVATTEVTLETQAANEPVMMSEPDAVSELNVVSEPVMMSEPDVVSELPAVIPYVEEIKEIYKTVGEPLEIPTVQWPVPEMDLSPAPMPADQLAQASIESGRILPGILKRLEDLKMSWAKPTSTEKVI